RAPATTPTRPTATASSGRGLLIHGGPTPAALAASTPTATPTPTPASVRTGAAVRPVLSILGFCVPPPQKSCPPPPVPGIRPRWWIALLQWAHRCTAGG